MKRIIKDIGTFILGEALYSMARNRLRDLTARVSLAVELTNRCNLRCAMCPQGQMKRKNGFMNIDTFRKIVDQSRKFRYPLQWFHVFGEPLLYPQLKEALEYFAKYGFGQGGISTNGLLLDDKKIDLIAGSCKLIRVSIDTTREDCYKVIRNNDNFKLLCKNTKRLIDRSKGSPLKIEIQCLETTLNKGEGIEEFQRLFGIHENVRYFKKESTQFGGDTPDLRIDKYKGDVKSCGMPYVAFSIGWNGDCVFCCFDYELTQKIGNINENNLKDIWTGSRARFLRSQLKKDIFDNLPFCQKCPGPGGVSK